MEWKQPGYQLLADSAKKPYMEVLGTHSLFTAWPQCSKRFTAQSSPLMYDVIMWQVCMYVRMWVIRCGRVAALLCPHIEDETSSDWSPSSLCISFVHFTVVTWDVHKCAVRHESGVYVTNSCGWIAHFFLSHCFVLATFHHEYWLWELCEPIG